MSKLLAAGRQFAVFGMVGLVATALQATTFAALVSIAATPTLVANSIGFALGFVVSFLGHFHLTFASPRRRPARAALARFLLTAAFSFGLNTVAVWTVVDYLGWHYLVAVAVMLVPIPILVFVSARFWAFRQPRAAG